MIPNLPVLAILPVEKLLLHEHHDSQRAIPLIQRLRTGGVLRNPPIVTPLGDRSNRYMVMDGANRTTAFLEMSIPHLLVQVVQQDDPNLKLLSWNHVIWDLSPNALLDGLQHLELDIRPASADAGYQDVLLDRALCLIHLRCDRVFTVHRSGAKLSARVKLLNAVVDTYRNRSSYDRTNQRALEPLGKLYPNISGLVIFPQFRVDEVCYLAGEGHLLPSGITRFSISPRVLRVNYPLQELSDNKSVAEKNQALQRWTQDRVARKNVRYYSEATVLYDE